MNVSHSSFRISALTLQTTKQDRTEIYCAHVGWHQTE